MRLLLGAFLAACGVASGAQPELLWSRDVGPVRQAEVSRGLAVGLASNAAGDVFAAMTSSVDGAECARVSRHALVDGAERWSRSLCGAGAVRVATDGNGDVVLLATNTSGLLRVVKMSGADGTVRWDRTLAFPGAQVISARAMAIDATNAVVVAGSVLTTKAALGVAKLAAGDGTIAWQQIYLRPNAQIEEIDDVAIHPSGDPFVLATGHKDLSPYDRDWTVLRVAADSGTVSWTATYDSGKDDFGNALRIDASGDAIVAGSSSMTSATNAGKVAKVSASGAIAWVRTLYTNSGFAASLVALPNDVIYVAGGSDSQFAIWSFQPDGTLLMEADFGKPYGGPGTAAVISANAAGTVAIAGNEAGAGSASTAGRVVRMRATGELEWSTATQGDLGLEEPVGVLAMPDGSVVSAWTSWAIVSGNIVATYRLVRHGEPRAAARLNAQGLWWKMPGGSESGWGVDLVQQGDGIFLTMFTYDASGKPTWTVATGMTARRGIDDAYAGTLYRASGPPYSSATFDPASVALAPAGSVAVAFSDADRGILTITNASGSVQSIPITRDVFAPSNRCTFAAAPATGRHDDMWWRSVESGWGLDVVHQGEVIFATWYTYAADRTPTWFVASSMVKADDGSYAGTLYRTAGSDPLARWDPARFTITPVGTARLRFAGSTDATFETVVDGLAQSRGMTRYVFGTPVTSCP